MYVCMCVCVYVYIYVYIYIYASIRIYKKEKGLINTKFKVAFSCGRFVKWMCSVT